jgi:hypothetical protein
MSLNFPQWRKDAIEYLIEPQEGDGVSREVAAEELIEIIHSYLTLSACRRASGARRATHGRLRT